ncbi:hypothetical protein GY21_12250, partial [Cryobacterium roopkundense]
MTGAACTLAFVGMVSGFQVAASADAAQAAKDSAQRASVAVIVQKAAVATAAPAPVADAVPVVSEPAPAAPAPAVPIAAVPQPVPAPGGAVAA